MTIATEQEIIQQRFHAQAQEQIQKRYNGYPNHDKYKWPVITEEEPEKITMRYWGILPVCWKRSHLLSSMRIISQGKTLMRLAAFPYTYIRIV